jgi:hypothetical protein
MLIGKLVLESVGYWHNDMTVSAAMVRLTPNAPSISRPRQFRQGPNFVLHQSCKFLAACPHSTTESLTLILFLDNQFRKRRARAIG